METNAAATGVVTLFMTDVEGSTKLWEHETKHMKQAMALHDRLANEIVTEFQGKVVKLRGEGDALFCTFESPSNAVLAAVKLQQTFSETDWPISLPLQVRIAIHCGEISDLRDSDLYGPSVNRCARIKSLGHGGQIIISQAVRLTIASNSLPGIEFLNLGEHRLRDLSVPEQLYQVCTNGLKREFAPLNSQSKLPHSLLFYANQFIGRTNEISELKEQVGSRRIVTILGSGGTGKTRLALQVASEIADQFQHGVVVVELADVTDPTGVLLALASSLGVQEHQNLTKEKAVIEHLKPLQMLLLLDNCEHVIVEVSQILSAILKGAPEIKVLSTSRERVGVYGESIFVLEPFSAQSSDAFDLFVARATDSDPGFRIQDDSHNAITRICKAVDGLPVLIEIVAAHVRGIPLPTLAGLIEQHLSQLVTNSPSHSGRHASLDAMIAWSYNLLDDSQKLLIERLSCFKGGWTAEAATQVCSMEPLNAFMIVAGQGALVDKSLLSLDQVNQRFRILETIRSFSAELHRNRGEEEATQMRHADYYLSLADKASKAVGSTMEANCHNDLDLELPNIRVALLTLERYDPCRAATMLVKLFRYFDSRAFFSEFRSIADRLLYHNKVQSDEPTYALLAQAAANTARRLGNNALAKFWIGEALQIFRKLGNEKSISSALSNLSSINLHAHEFDLARQQATESAELARKSQNERPLVSALLVNANVSLMRNEFQDAENYLLDAQSVCMRHGLDDLILYVQSNLGLSLTKQSKHSAALETYCQIVEQLIKTPNRPLLIETFRFAAAACLVLEKFEESLHLYLLEEKLRQEHGILLGEHDSEEREGHMQVLAKKVNVSDQVVPDDLNLAIGVAIKLMNSGSKND